VVFVVAAALAAIAALAALPRGGRAAGPAPGRARDGQRAGARHQISA
jgi:hypothetical protein